jgi:hypothetical protein
MDLYMYDQNFKSNKACEDPQLDLDWACLLADEQNGSSCLFIDVRECLKPSNWRIMTRSAYNTR